MWRIVCAHVFNQKLCKYTNKSRTKQQIHLFFVEREYIRQNKIAIVWL